MKKSPIWAETAIPKFPPLVGSRRFDVVVVGGGITGLTTAHLLKQAGKRVAIVERANLGSADTRHTTAHLTYVTDDRLSHLAKAFGEQTAGRVWEAGRIAIDKIEEIVDEADIHCDFRRVPGYLLSPLQTDVDDADGLRADAELASKLGFAASFESEAPYFHKPCARFADQAKFNPAAFLAGLASAINGDDSAIFEQTEVTEFKTDPLQLVAGAATIDCDYVVIATHSPLMGNAGVVGAALFQTKLYPYTSYVLGAKMPRGLLPEADFWDTDNPYYYLRVDAGEHADYAIFGGKDHKTGQEPDTVRRFDELTAVLQHWLPDAKVDRRWSGQVIETNDGLPYIGETADRQFVATGFAGNGMTFGVFSALLACDWIEGKKTGWHELFSPGRVKVRGGALDYVLENLDYPYYFIRDRIGGPPASTLEDIRRNEGAVVKTGGGREACFRDSHGHLTRLSAVCPHLGCIVRWNPAEKTWDCPCHSSRFHPTGEVLAGPAESSLTPIDVEAIAKK